MNILVTGLSTRAIAESAVRGGHQVITLDYFGDRDQRALVENHALLRDLGLPFSAEALLQTSRRLDFEAAVYISTLENHPDVVEQLAQGHILLGNTPTVLNRVRDWYLLRTFCHDTGIHCPVTLLPGEEREATVCPIGSSAVRWLRKPVHSGGGHGIQSWTGNRLDHRYILQAYVEGRHASAAFVADGRHSVVIGLTEQLIGQGELGARGFAWCGNILPLAVQSAERAAVLRTVETIAAQLTHYFGLRGVNGIDVVIADGPDGHPRTFLIEVNPRYTASMELMERAYGLNVFSLHLDAMAGRLPDFSLAEHLRSQGAAADADCGQSGAGGLPFTLQGTHYGKGIVYARRTVSMPETAEWVERDRRDIPFPGERIEAGHPVCTVLAEGKGREACWNHLLASAEAVRREIGDEVANQRVGESTNGRMDE